MNEEDDDCMSLEGDETSFSWMSFFLAKAEHKFFCRIEESYIQDAFNLYGLSNQIQYYDWALDLITDVVLDDEDQSFLEENQELIENDAEVLYGMAHARYIMTNRGLYQMFEKYKRGEFGKCRHYFCKGQNVLPNGLTDEKNKESVKLYCPSCERVYCPDNKQYESVDGAYFGTTFSALFFMTFPQLKVKKPPSYFPKLYGFPIHPDAYERSQQSQNPPTLANVPDQQRI